MVLLLENLTDDTFMEGSVETMTDVFTQLTENFTSSNI